MYRKGLYFQIRNTVIIPLHDIGLFEHIEYLFEYTEIIDNLNRSENVNKIHVFINMSEECENCLKEARCFKSKFFRHFMHFLQTLDDFAEAGNKRATIHYYRYDKKHFSFKLLKNEFHNLKFEGSRYVLFSVDGLTICKGNNLDISYRYYTHLDGIKGMSISVNDISYDASIISDKSNVCRKVNERPINKIVSKINNI
ncbi:MAG: hypothetical protein PHC62_00955 [Candidatus Izemoplasmatales bacterium]|nr:hypothetical protein [Candidatus Izemoplasmatales bacterium]